MSATGQVCSTTSPLSVKQPAPTPGLIERRLYCSDLVWWIAFLLPYAAVFLAFAVYPLVFALWMAGKPSLYADLLQDPLYPTALINTLLFVGIGVNVKMFLALVLSGFFMRRRWWIKTLFVIYMVPWALAAVQAFISVHWILIGEPGLVNRLLDELFGIEGPIWFNDRRLALGADIAAYIWKWMPFWTAIFVAGRMAIPRDLNDAAAIDGATGVHRFVHLTFPLLANLYLVCTLLSTLWTVGDFNTVFFVSGGAPAMSTDVLATLAWRYTFDSVRPELGLAAIVSALPVLIPIVIFAIRRLHTREVQL
jgi:multiple sugar transport system permease protein